MPFEPSPHREEIIQALRDGDAEGIPAFELIADVSKRFPVSRRTVERYYKDLKAGKLEVKEKPPKVSDIGGKFATVAARQPAPVIFVLGEHKIELEPEAIYESYLLYMDMQLRCSLNSTFSGVLRDGMGLLWRVIASEPIIEKGEVKMEVSYGGSPGHGKEEVGIGQ